MITRPQLIEINATGNALRLPLDFMLTGILFALNQRGNFLSGEVEGTTSYRVN
jgi:hypothetical protein